MVKHLDLFSGICGFALATEMMWGEVEHTFCDNEPFAQAIIKKHWPQSKIYGDIRTLTAFAGQIDLLTGGFPCQPFSAAGKRRGTEDSRHLWPEMLRVIREFKPRWVIGENVGGLVTWSNGMVLEQIHLDLEAEGYEVQAFIIPAVALNAPHRRDRVWIVAHATGNDAYRNTGEFPQSNEQKPQTLPNQRVAKSGGANSSNGSYSSSKRLQRQRNEAHKPGTKSNDQFSYGRNRGRPLNTEWERNWPEVAAALCRVDDGIPRRLDRTARLKGLGNAIVPQVAAQIMQAIKEADPTML